MPPSFTIYCRRFYPIIIVEYDDVSNGSFLGIKCNFPFLSWYLLEWDSPRKIRIVTRYGDFTGFLLVKTFQCSESV